LKPGRSSVRSLAVQLLAVVFILSSGCSSPPVGNDTDLSSTARNGINALAAIGPVSAPLNSAKLETVECWFHIPTDAPMTSCYRMHVPENHDRADSPLINFPVIKLSAEKASKPKTPVLHLGGGGPGNPIGFDPDAVGLWLWSWYQQMSVSDQRDLYLIDPRGVGLAQPVLVCKEYIPAFLGSLSRNLTVEQEIIWNTEVNQQCAERLTASGIELGAYNSFSIARDMELLRRAFDIERWNLYGVSYGSRYALTIAREFPDTIDAMVLDATVFPNVRYMDNYATNLEQAFNRLIKVCNESSSCSNVLEDPEQRFWNLVRKLQRNPIRTTIKHPQREQQINLVLNGERFLSVFYNALYDAAQFSDLPEVITSLENNELGIFEQKINDWLAFQTDEDYGDASAAAHYCHEESPFINYKQAIETASGLRNELRTPTIALLRFNQQQCERWPVKPAGAIEGEPVITRIPTLFLHGALDPVLPVENLELQLSYFSQSAYEIFPDMSHSIVGVHPCGESMAQAFYNFKLGFRAHINCIGQPQ